MYRKELRTSCFEVPIEDSRSLEVNPWKKEHKQTRKEYRAEMEEIALELEESFYEAVVEGVITETEDARYCTIALIGSPCDHYKYWIPKEFMFLDEYNGKERLHVMGKWVRNQFLIEKDENMQND